MGWVVAIGRAARATAICAGLAAALVPVLGLVPLAILRHHLRRALAPALAAGTGFAPR